MASATFTYDTELLRARLGCLPGAGNPGRHVALLLSVRQNLFLLLLSELLALCSRLSYCDLMEISVAKSTAAILSREGTSYKGVWHSEHGSIDCKLRLSSISADSCCWHPSLSDVLHRPSSMSGPGLP